MAEILEEVLAPGFDKTSHFKEAVANMSHPDVYPLLSVAHREMIEAISNDEDMFPGKQIVLQMKDFYEQLCAQEATETVTVLIVMVNLCISYITLLGDCAETQQLGITIPLLRQYFNNWKNHPNDHTKAQFRHQYDVVCDIAATMMIATFRNNEIRQNILAIQIPQ